MSKKLVLISSFALVFATVLSVVTGDTASAHFILRDGNSDLKALFHVTPDHDPIAGKESTISYDFSKTSTRAEDFTYTLTIKSGRGESTQIPTEIASNVVLARYTFPSKGLYRIILLAEPKYGGKEATLLYAQRVSRGEAMKQPIVSPFEASVIGATILLAGLAVMISSREDIAKWSGQRRGVHDKTHKK